jgi:hypothetical protein
LNVLLDDEQPKNELEVFPLKPQAQSVPHVHALVAEALATHEVNVQVEFP